ncbi:MAG: sulfotransferase [Candidatus Marinimicrobia bacterium]|nr:sulfotransferase [Candidatus Neomarinimicrobiota bacterium]
MRNVLILGSGRSGTSMVAGTLASAGYFMGDRLYPPRHSNPKGFFEDPEINGINEKLISLVTPNRPPIIGKYFFRARPVYGQRWLSRVPLSVRWKMTREIEERIWRVVYREPYCFKDPRFSYTLPVWRPFLKDCCYICVFRDPAATVNSILKECSEVGYLFSLKINRKIALEVWELMYTHILEYHVKEGDWLFIHYDQVPTKEGLDKIEDFTGAKVDRSFPEKDLKRSKGDFEVDSKLREIYSRLCEFAGYVPR